MQASFININSFKFSLNGVQHHKVFVPVKVSDTHLKIVSVYDVRFVLLDATKFSDITIGGAGFANINTLITSLNDVIYSRVVLQNIAGSLGYTPLDKATYPGTAADLSASIEAIAALVASDDTNLDELQEIVTFIKQNKTDLQNLSVTNIAGLVEALAEKAGLNHNHDGTYHPLFPYTPANDSEVVKGIKKSDGTVLVPDANRVITLPEFAGSSTLIKHTIPVEELSATPTNENIVSLVAEWFVSNAITVQSGEILSLEVVKGNVLLIISPTQNLEDLTTVRNSTASYLDANGIIQTAAINELRIDHTTGSPKILIEKKVINYNTHSYDLTAAATPSNVSVALSETGLKGLANTATLITDASTTNIGEVSKVIFGMAGKNKKVSLWIKKDENEARFPELYARILPQAGGVAESSILQINTKTGASAVRSGIADFPLTVIDRDLWWEIAGIFDAPENLNEDRILLYVRPSAGATLGSADNAVTGSITVGYLGVTDSNQLIDSPIITNGAAATREADIVSISPPEGTAEIVTTVDGVATSITTIPSSYQLPVGNISSISFNKTSTGGVLTSLYKGFIVDRGIGEAIGESNVFIVEKPTLKNDNQPDYLIVDNYRQASDIDDTNAFKSAIQVAKDENVKVIFAPLSTYTISETIFCPSNVTIFGMGREATTINLSSAANLTSVTPVNGLADYFTWKPMFALETSDIANEGSVTENFFIRDLGINWNGQTIGTYSASELFFGRGKNCHAMNVKFHDVLPSDLVDTSNYSNCFITAFSEDCTISKSWVGAAIYESASFWFESKNCRSIKNEYVIDKPLQFGIQIHAMQAQAPVPAIAAINALRGGTGYPKDTYSIDDNINIVRNCKNIITGHGAEGLHIQGTRAKVYSTCTNLEKGIKAFDGAIDITITGCLIDFTEFFHFPKGVIALAVGSESDTHIGVKNAIVTGNRVKIKNTAVYGSAATLIVPVIGSEETENENVNISDNIIEIDGYQNSFHHMIECSGKNITIGANHIKLTNPLDVIDDTGFAAVNTKGGTNITISKNKVIGTIGQGVKIEGTAIALKNIVIKDNQFEDVVGDEIAIDQAHPDLAEVDSGTIPKEHQINGTRIDNVAVTGTYNIDYNAGSLWVLTLTGATTLTESNIPSGTNTKAIELEIIGDFALDVPTRWVKKPSSQTYLGTVKNSFLVSSHSETRAVYSLENLE